jgi:hypothetical protein
VGVRDELGYFQNHLHAQVILLTGRNGSDGWFALRSVPESWASEPGANDGIENFALAGPGLGSPDANGNRESLLHAVPNVVPVRADGLNLLVGRTVCAVVYASDIAPTGGATDLAGPTLGRVAFKLVSVIPVDGAAPNVQVEILEGHEVCSEGVVPFGEAPDPS